MFPYKFGGTALLGVYLLASNIQQQPIAKQVTDDLLAADAKQYFAFDVGPTVESLIASGRQFDKVHSTYLLTSHPHAEVSPGHAPLADPLADFSALVWNCDAAVLATPTARRSALTVGHKFIFSDYTVSLDRVYFDNTHSLSPGGTIVVSRAGGATVLNSVNIRAIETEFPLFRLNERYLFFLHRSPSGSFQINPSDAFLLTGNGVIQAKNHPDFDLSRSSFEQLESRVLTDLQRKGEPAK